MSAQTWKVVATTAQRFYLASLLLDDAIKLKGRKADTILWRARTALGLIGVSELILKSGKVATRPLLSDPRTHVFTVTAENADFLLECREKVEIGSGVSNILRELLEQLTPEHRERELPEYSEVPEWTPALEPAELELWTPPRETDPPPPDDAG